MDSGATHSVINQAWFDRHRIKTDVEPSVNILEVANGHLVKTKGEATWDLRLKTSKCHEGVCAAKGGDKRKHASFQQKFIVADLGETYPCILGMDWLTQNQVIIDPVSKCVQCRALGGIWACSNRIKLPQMEEEEKPGVDIQEVDMDTF